MKDVRVGLSERGMSTVTYFMSDIKDIYRIVNEISKVIGKIGMSSLTSCLPFYNFRYSYSETTGDLLVVSIMEESKKLYNIKIQNKGRILNAINGSRNVSSIIFAGDLEEVTKKQVSEVDENLELLELPSGLYYLDISSYLEKEEEKLRHVCLSLLNSNKDIWLRMGSDDIERISWKPDYINGKYALVQSIIYSTAGNEDDIKYINETEIVLC